MIVLFLVILFQKGNCMIASKRNLSFDIARAIAIYLVIIGHSMTGLWDTWQSNFIFAANLPIFFIISGYFYHSKRIKDVVQTGVNTLLIPFFIVTLLYITLRTALGEIVQHVHYLNFQTLIPLIYGNGATGQSPFGFELSSHAGAVWFLPTMFIANIIFHWLMKSNKEIIRFTIVIILFGSGYSLAQVAYFPWSLQAALEVPIYYLFGYWLAKLIKHHSQKTIFANPYILLVSLICWMLSATSGSYELNRGLADNMFIAVLGGFGSAIVLLGIAFFIEKHWHQIAKGLSYVGQYSLVLLCVHSLDIGLLDTEVMNFLESQAWFSGYSLFAYLGLMLLRILYTTCFTWILLKIKFIYNLLVDRNFPLQKA